MAKKDPRYRKFLPISLEDFFIAATLALGQPNMYAVGYPSKTMHGKIGIGFYLTETEDGRKFVAFVDSLGEAKRRAAALYKFWLRYYSTPAEARSEYAARLQNGWPKAHKRMAQRLNNGTTQ